MTTPTLEERTKLMSKWNAKIAARIEADQEKAAFIKAAGGLASDKTLRDEFAGQAEGLGLEADDNYADRFNADKKPPRHDYFAWAKWFAKADATVRYIRADAMLEARKTTGEGE
jgi:hypothetical protein